MARYSRSPKPSPETQQEAIKIARSMQRPGQTKAQTKLIAQGIKKGIDQYKRQQKAKARELDRKLKQPQNPGPPKTGKEPEVGETVRYRQHWLPWLLLGITWVGIAAYLALTLAARP